MEPGHEDREYAHSVEVRGKIDEGPQWSPVMKTGNTRPCEPDHVLPHRASMEPGHEDREYEFPAHPRPGVHRASMEPGHEDREYDVFNIWF